MGKAPIREVHTNAPTVTQERTNSPTLKPTNMPIPPRHCSFEVKEHNIFLSHSRRPRSKLDGGSYCAPLDANCAMAPCCPGTTCVVEKGCYRCIDVFVWYRKSRSYERILL